MYKIKKIRWTKTNMGDPVSRTPLVDFYYYPETKTLQALTDATTVEAPAKTLGEAKAKAQAIWEREVKRFLVKVKA